ncbi:MAG: DNA polymerase III subunit delta [Nitrospirota bacterium]
MNVRPQELSATIGRQGIASLYLVVGEEDCLRDQAVAAIRAAVLGGGSGASAPDGGLEAFNHDLLYGDETGAAEILARAGEVPVFASRRLVMVKAAEKLPAREGEALLSYCKAPCDTTTLVFVAAKLDGRTKFAQGLGKAAVVVDCSALTEWDLTGWITREAVSLGVQLTGEAVQTLKERVLSLKDQAGGALYPVRRELEKLAAYVPKGSIAGPAELEAVRGMEAGASVFDLTAAIAAGDRERVLRIAARNLEAGEAPVRILGSLVWQYRRIWKVKDLLRQGGTESEAARHLRMPPFKVKAFLSRFPDPALRSAFRLFLETDSKLKGGSATAPERSLESLLLALCSLGGAGTGGKGQPADRDRPSSSLPTKPAARAVRPGRPTER